MLRALVALAATSMALHPSLAGEIHRFSPERVVVQEGRPDHQPFVGILRADFRGYALSSPDPVASDRFRSDAVMIWSASTSSPWNLLPPKHLGQAE